MRSQPLPDNSLTPAGPGEEPVQDNAAAATETDKPAANADEPAANADETEQPTEAEQPNDNSDPFQRRGVFDRPRAEESEFDPAREQFTGAVLGMALAGFRDHEGRDTFFVLPGDDVQITVPTVSMPPKVVTSSFTIVDFYESKMDLFDSAFIFVPLRRLQEMRGMIDPTTGMTSVTSIQIKLKPGVDGDMVCDLLRKQFGERVYNIGTWRDKQTALLKAVAFETAILNVLLFLIIAVAGFGIVAIFYMIVVEKTRDIGVLKSLGASGRGVMGIFLAYGLSLGLAGSGIGMGLGLLLVYYINQIADIVGTIRGQKVFDPSVYYLQKIPTIVDPVTVSWIVVGALAIAVLASILPARRAAGLHPVEALRYE